MTASNLCQIRSFIPVIPFRRVFDLASNPNRVYLWLGRHGAETSWATDFAETVVRYRGQLLELKTSNNQTGFHNINCAKDKRGRKNPYYAKFLPPGEKKQRMLPGSTSATAEGAAVSWPGMWRRSRSCEPLFLSASLASQPRCAAAMHCVSYHVYASRTLTHSCHRRFT